MENNEITMYNVKDVQNIFRCSQTHAYELVNSNGFPAMRIGRKILVEKRLLEKWIEKNCGKKIIVN